MARVQVTRGPTDTKLLYEGTEGNLVDGISGAPALECVPGLAPRRLPDQGSNCSTRFSAFPQKIINAVGHFPAREHATEGFVDIGLGAGLAQRVLVVEPDVDNQLDRLRGEAEEKTIALRQSFFYPPPVAVAPPHRLAQPKIPHRN